MRSIRPRVVWVVPLMLALAVASSPATAQTLVAPSAGPVGSAAAGPADASGARPAAPEPGGGWVDLQRNGHRGIVALEWADRAGASARLSVHLSGFSAHDQVRILLSTAACAGSPPAAGRRFSARMPAADKGRVWRAHAEVALDAGSLAEIRTVRLMEEEGIFYVCRTLSVWDDTDIVHTFNGAVAVFDATPRRGIVVLGPADDAGARIAWSLTIGADADARLVGTSTACGGTLDGPSRLFSLPVPSGGTGVAFFRGRTETVDQNETIAIHGLHLRPKGEPAWTCERPAIIAIIIG